MGYVYPENYTTEELAKQFVWRNNEGRFFKVGSLVATMSSHVLCRLCNHDLGHIPRRWDLLEAHLYDPAHKHKHAAKLLGA